MCTAINFLSNHHYFGRNLDLDLTYGEGVIITPRSYIFSFRHYPTLTKHYAMIGGGITEDGYPLYYEATNEMGLSVAALNFNGYAKFGTGTGKHHIALYEFIPWVLGQCESVEGAEKLVNDMVFTNEPFNSRYPVPTLHFIISDKERSITVESVEEGVRIHKNPVGVLANNPDFNYHMTHLSDYMSVSTSVRQNTLTACPLNEYSNGLGGMGLPGDMSSPSRFVRGVFLSGHAEGGSGESEDVAVFFRLLGNLSQIKGCVRLPGGGCQYTVYSCCLNTDKGIYYYTTYNDPRIRAVKMTPENKCGSTLTLIPMNDECEIIFEN